MTKLFLNPWDDACIVSSRYVQVDMFDGSQQQKSFTLGENADFLYAMFVKNSEVLLDVVVESEASKAQIFVFVPAHEGAKSVVKVSSHIQASHSEVRVHLIAIQSEHSHIQLDGAMSIGQHVEGVVGHLLEEVVLLWNASYTSVQPVLDVASPDVQASHGAKVHRISPEVLFYLQSRGLSLGFAAHMIIRSYVERILGHFDMTAAERERIESFIG